MNRQTMPSKNGNVFAGNKIFAWIALGTAILLLIPLFSAQLNAGFRWALSDFIIAGLLIFGMSSLYVLAVRKLKGYQFVLAVIFVAVLLYVWAELAVGVFFNTGS